ncbi:FAD-dependent monooxygenase [Bacillus sp. ISL-35]|uniref:FAD-dependent monooxygenase n=1 Tax=Bacillus sp. ISL-35 TaxID=2819122 RepID=UPI001BEA6F34|nr:FAD-dependent monooxygenase [Bacillus sp. ISL-35]MBT2679077.1 FAD-dependent monooxygenase [Bacillus sp. ISL-35]MBT2704074.1 FAD-dependent monooxygenase [Chryseobacterium sp. ISL-80]
MEDEKIAIVGGGISGLCTAIALQKNGIHAEIYEKEKRVQQPDTGMILSGNAIRAFYLMGLGPELLAHGLDADACQLKSDFGNTIATFDYHAPSHIPNYLFIHRSSLQKILMDALLPGCLHLEKHLIDFTQGQVVTLFFKDGTTVDSDYLISCDGASSPIRSKLFPESTLTHTGYSCWRGLIEDPPLQVNAYTETWGARGKFGIAPLTDQQIFWYAFKKTSDDSSLSTWTPIDLLFNFFYYHDPIQELLENTSADQILYDDIYELKPLTPLQSENILFLGDSAHASMPNIGQGASQAAEDAVYLAKWLSKEASGLEAFKKYTQHKRERTKQIKDEMKIYGLASQVDFPILCSIRNKLLQMAPASFHNEKLRRIIEIEEDMERM